MLTIHNAKIAVITSLTAFSIACSDTTHHHQEQETRIEHVNPGLPQQSHTIEEVALQDMGRRKYQHNLASTDASADFMTPTEPQTHAEYALVAASVSTSPALKRMASEPIDRENYMQFDANPVKLVSEDPVSTFSIDTDTAAYSNLRRMLSREGRLPPRDAVKLEEMINYFSYDYPTPESVEQPFSVTTEVAPAPWNPQRQLLQIGLKGFEPQIEQRPNANLVFLVDVSGSMRSQDKLGLVKKSLRLLVKQMEANDHIALVVYAGAAGVVLESTSGSQRAKILAAIDSLEAGGSTNGGAGIRLAYNMAQQQFEKGAINRVIIASDGDMNVGTTSIEALKNLVEERRQSGVALTTLGYGSGNYNYALMEQLADIGNGNAAYIDTLKEAQKVLVDEMQSTLFTIARDVKVQIEFNPDIVAEYRLIGYENRMLNREDFRNDKVDAGEIGAGHTVTALYELTLANSEAKQIPELRYQHQPGTQDALERVQHNTSEIAFVRLRYKQAEAINSVEVAYPINTSQQHTSLALASDNLRFAASVAGFGQLLRGGKYTDQWRYDDALELARSSRGSDPHGYRSEMLSLIELAKSLSTEEVAISDQSSSTGR
jgi:Ca-activated chloride channel family protein